MASSAGKIVVLGLGGGGGRIAARTRGEVALGHVVVGAADTDVRALELLEDVAHVPLGQEWVRHEGCGGDLVLGERAASASSAELKQFIGGARLLFVVAGLGGGTGSAAAKVVARLARDTQVTAVFVVTLPFAFEGSWRRRQAEKLIAPLRELVDVVIAVPNDLLFTRLPADTPAQEAFQMADSLLACSVGGLARLTSAHALIPADYASLRALLGHRDATCTLGVGSGTGENRWQDAIDSFLASPLIGGREALAKANAAVITLLVGTDVSIGEINTCLTAFQQQLPNSVQLVVGAYADEALSGEFRMAGLLCEYHDLAATPAPPPPEDVKPRKRSRKSRGRRAADGPVQGELPLQEQALGVFSGVTPTTVAGQNLDIPTFQRRGIHLDVGD